MVIEFKVLAQNACERAAREAAYNHQGRYFLGGVVCNQEGYMKDQGWSFSRERVVEKPGSFIGCQGGLAPPPPGP